MDAEEDGIGRFLPTPFNPLQQVIILDYIHNPFHVHVLTLREVLKEYRTLSNELDHWTRQVREAKGRGVLCFSLSKYKTETYNRLFLVNLASFWATAPSYAPCKRDSGLPPAHARRGAFDTWHLKPKTDALEDLLSQCGATLDQFIKSDFNERAFKWLKGVLPLAGTAVDFQK